MRAGVINVAETYSLAGARAAQLGKAQGQVC
jgi:hypothetical protein